MGHLYFEFRIRKMDDLEIAGLWGDPSFESQLAEAIQLGEITVEQADQVRRRVESLRDAAHRYEVSRWPLWKRVLHRFR